MTYTYGAEPLESPYNEVLRVAEAERQIIFEDLQAILRELGLSDSARPYSAHEVVQREILPAIRRLRRDRGL
jgi:hypothetical protein